MDNLELRKEFGNSVAGKLHSLAAQTPANKHILAELRKLGGASVVDATSAWQLLYQGRSYEASEWQKDCLDNALLAILSLFAVQARQNPLAYLKKSDGGLSVGGALSSMRKKQTNPDSFDSKVVGVLREDNYEGIMYRLNSLLRQQDKLSLDYVDIAWDFYLLQGNSPKNVILKWGKDYYGLTDASSNTAVLT